MGVMVQVEKPCFGPYRGTHEHWEHFEPDTPFETELPESEWPWYMKRVGDDSVRNPDDVKTEKVQEIMTLQEGGDDASEIAVLGALQKLDHSNDDHWTELGLPMVTAVNAIILDAGGKAVTRAEIKAAAPDFVREQ